jgi:hypothetical protein
VDWHELGERAERRYRDGIARLPTEGDARQKQLVRTANAAGAAGLCHAMRGQSAEAKLWHIRAAESYRQSWDDAPAGSWGRPIGAVKNRILAGDWEGAAADARWALEQGSALSDSPIGRYAATLALLTLGADEEAGSLAIGLRQEPDVAFPRPVAEALAGLAARDRSLYGRAIRDVLASFEARDAFLEDVPVADTVVVLEALAEPRVLAVRPASPLLPSRPGP